MKTTIISKIPALKLKASADSLFTQFRDTLGRLNDALMFEGSEDDPVMLEDQLNDIISEYALTCRNYEYAKIRENTPDVASACFKGLTHPGYSIIGVAPVKNAIGDVVRFSEKSMDVAFDMVQFVETLDYSDEQKTKINAALKNAANMAHILSFEQIVPFSDPVAKRLRISYGFKSGDENECSKGKTQAALQEAIDTLCFFDNGNGRNKLQLPGSDVNAVIKFMSRYNKRDAHKPLPLSFKEFYDRMLNGYFRDLANKKGWSIDEILRVDMSAPDYSQTHSTAYEVVDVEAKSKSKAGKSKDKTAA